METEDRVTNLDDMFGDNSHKIIKDAQALSLDYVPDQIVGRRAEINELVKTFKPIDVKGYPSNAIIFGNSGYGKTVVAKFVLQKIIERVENKRLMDHPLRWVYIPCKKHKTEIKVIFETITQLNPRTNVPKTGLAPSEYYDALWDLIKEQNISLIMVLDEIDKLKNGDLLYNLSRAGESHQLPERHFLTTIGISNDFDFGKYLDTRTKSSMNFKDVIFSAYNAEQIKLILCDRVKLAFFPGAISNGTIELCAAISAKAHGDARKAIDLLRVAAIYAEENGFSQVLPEHIDKAFEDIDGDRMLKFVPKLALHDKLVLLSIIKTTGYNKPVTNVRQVTAMYNKLCDKIEEKRKGRTTVSTKVGELLTMSFIKVISLRRGRGEGGRELELNVSSRKVLEDALYEDYNLEDLRNFNPVLFLT